MVGRALCLLLEGSGYRTVPIDAYPTGVVDQLLEDAELLLLAPRLDEGVREAFVGAMGKSTPQRASMPVIALTTPVEEDLPEKEGVIRVPWPSETKVLVERIEAALLDVPASSSSTTVLLPPGYSLERSDADVLVLRCPNGTVVAPFSAWGVAAEAIEQEARMHYKKRNRSA
jgi:hypothetical protein